VKEWVIRWWAEAALGGMVAALGIGYRRIRKRVRAETIENKAIRRGMLALLRGKLVDDYTRYMQAARWPLYAREATMDLYDQYRALGGNGVVADLVQDLKDLPMEKTASRPAKGLTE
jgi:hypothetical protein